MVKKIRTKRSAAKGNDMPTSAHDVIVGDTPEGKKSAEAEEPVNIPTFFWAMVVILGIAMLYFANGETSCKSENKKIINETNQLISQAERCADVAKQCVGEYQLCMSEYKALTNVTRSCIDTVQRNNEIICTWSSFVAPCGNQSMAVWEKVK